MNCPFWTDELCCVSMSSGSLVLASPSSDLRSQPGFAAQHLGGHSACYLALYLMQSLFSLASDFVSTCSFYVAMRGKQIWLPSLTFWKFTATFWNYFKSNLSLKKIILKYSTYCIGTIHYFCCDLHSWTQYWFIMQPSDVGSVPDCKKR